MTYTISTEPVTREHIGRQILGRQDEDEFTQSLLIVENPSP